MFYSVFGLSKIANDTLTALLTQLGALAFESAAAVILLVALGAACQAVKILNATGVAQDIFDLFEGGGTVSVSGSSDGQSAGPVVGNVSFGSAPSLTLVFPAFVCIDHVDLSLTTQTLLVGETDQATATAKDKNNNIVSGATFVYSSTNELVATIDPNTGLLTGKSPGVSSITAVETTSGKKSSPATATVQPIIGNP